MPTLFDPIQAGDLRLAKRLARKPDYRDAMTGFRVVMEETNTIP